MYHGPIKFRQIECADENWMPVAKHQRLCKNIDAYPTMKLFSGSKEIETYDGERSAAALVQYAKNHDHIQHGSAPKPHIKKYATPSLHARKYAKELMDLARQHDLLRTQSMPAALAFAPPFLAR